jgi:HD-like signal output (HDOD) protein
MSFLLRLQGFLRAGTELPTLPASVLEIQSALAAEEVPLGELVAIVERDPALAARLLRTANSALYARGGERVSALGPAIGRIGLRQLRAVSLAGSVLQIFKARSASLRPEAFWSHSAAVGVASRTLAQALSRPDLDPDVCYTAGLLHDVGLLVLDQFFPEDYAIIAGQRKELELPWWQQEEDTFGLDHGEIGGLLLGHWGLPSMIVEAVTFHHRPSDAHDGVRSAAYVVHAAEILVATDPLALPDEGMETAELGPVLEVLGAGDRLESLTERMRTAVHGSAGVLA